MKSPAGSMLLSALHSLLLLPVSHLVSLLPGLRSLLYKLNLLNKVIMRSYAVTCEYLYYRLMVHTCCSFVKD